MRHYYLPAVIGDFSWHISPWTGSLLRKRATPAKHAPLHLPEKLKSALALCENPFSCRWASQPSDVFLDGNDFASLEKCYRRLLMLGSGRFFLSTLYARQRLPCVDTTHEVFSGLSRIRDASENRSVRCLQRCLTAVKTSRSFPDGGVLFIGACTDALTMHAWILEDGMQPDPYDRQWINYRPLVAFSY